jgi:hypothetical protein
VPVHPKAIRNRQPLKAWHQFTHTKPLQDHHKVSEFAELLNLGPSELAKAPAMGLDDRINTADLPAVQRSLRSPSAALTRA